MLAVLCLRCGFDVSVEHSCDVLQEKLADCLLVPQDAVAKNKSRCVERYRPYSAACHNRLSIYVACIDETRCETLTGGQTPFCRQEATDYGYACPHF